MAINFCTSCGSALENRMIGGLERRACPTCDFVHWGAFSIGVGALVVKDDKVLLVRRAQEPGKGLWTNPGGYCEEHELIDGSVEREVLEETGIRATVDRVVAVRDQARIVHNLYVAFAMNYVDGIPTPDGIEVDEAGFFSHEEMKGMNVAGMTRWLVDVALSGGSNGLAADDTPVLPQEQNRLFRR